MKTKRHKKATHTNGGATKRDILNLSAKINRNQKSIDQLGSVTKKLDSVSQKIDRNQKALDQLDTVSKKIDEVTLLISKNQNALDQLEDVGRIIRENEQNLKDLGGLKHRLDTLDKIMISVDKIAGSVQSYQQEQTISSNRLSNHEDRLETIEKHLNIPAVA